MAHEGQTQDGQTQDGQTQDGQTQDGQTQDGQTQDGQTNEGPNLIMASIAALTLAPGLTGSGWIAVGYPIMVGIAWMAGPALAGPILALTLSRRNQQGRVDRREMARMSFMGTMGNHGGCSIVPVAVLMILSRLGQ